MRCCVFIVTLMLANRITLGLQQEKIANVLHFIVEIVSYFKGMLIVLLTDSKSKYEYK